MTVGREDAEDKHSGHNWGYLEKCHCSFSSQFIFFPRCDKFRATFVLFVLSGLKQIIRRANSKSP